MSMSRVMVVDDENLICWSMSKTLERAGYKVVMANSGAEARRKFESFKPGMVLLDLCLPDADGLELLQEFKEADEDVMVLMVTATALAETVFQAFKHGAEDYIGKPFNLDDLVEAVQGAFEKKRMKREMDTFRRPLRKKFDFDQLVGSSPKMIEVFKLIGVCAETDCKTVLILGESGTGKELVAQAIHNQSARREAPFIEVNCAAIPENLLENELFGHEQGAFTSAGNREKGIFEQAGEGTVFLDEIGDMPLTMQTKILKVIETKRLRRLGGKEDLQADVRIIAATNQDLPKMVAEGTFRGDLFYRLNMMWLRLPPLRERKECIPNVINYFIERLNDEYGRSVEGLSEESLEILTSYDWPGNVRELRNTIERAMMLERGKVLSAGYFRHEIPLEARAEEEKVDDDETDLESYGTSQPFGNIVLPPEGVSIEEIEKEYIQQALARYDGNQTKAAKCLGVSLDTMRYRRKKYGLEDYPPKEKPSTSGVATGEVNSAPLRQIGSTLIN